MNRSIAPIMKTMIVAVTALILMSGCVATDARDLAKSTAANVSVVNTGLEEFKARRLALAEARARTADHLNQVIVRESESLNLQLEVAKMAGETGWINQYNAYLKLADTLVQQQRKIDATRDQIRTIILKQQKDLALPTAELTQAERLLADLGGEPGTTEQIAFFKSYFAAVIKDYQEATKKQAAAEDAAKKGTVSKQKTLSSEQSEMVP